MSLHQFTPRGQISSARIDKLLVQYEPDEWLPAALAVPLGLGLFACLLMVAGLALVIFVPTLMAVGLTLAALWILGVAYSYFSMDYLCRRRRAERRFQRNQ